MKDLSNYYKLLGVNKNSSADDIKKAYRSKAKESHPDVLGGNKERFQLVTEAYNILICELENPTNNTNNTNNNNNNSYSNSHNNSTWNVYGNEKVYSYYEEMGFGNHSHTNFYEDNNNNTVPPPFTSNTIGEDIYINVDISYEEQSQYKTVGIVFKRVSYKRQLQCTSCKGLGHKTYSCVHCSGYGYKNEVSFVPGYGKATTSNKCNVCDGNGYIGRTTDKCLICKGLGYVESLFESDVPIDLNAVIERQQRTFVFEGLGHEVLNPKQWGPSGNLIVKVTLLTKTQIDQKVYINFIQALEGCSMQVDLDGGKFKPNVNIPSGIKSGTKLKVSKDNNNYLIEVLITVPKWNDLSKKAQRLFTQLKEEL